jgi:iron complex outermembrane recepter protein
MNLRTWKFKVAALPLAAASVMSVAVAQTSPNSATATTAPVSLEKFVVTGSLIPVAAGSTTVPIQVLSSVDIDRTGISTDLADVLRRNQPTFYGANNLGSDRANTDSGDSNGGSGLSLRNRSTLVLVNGRRAATSPVTASGGYTFVDVSTIPIAAVERIEILPDGASATYGSDAVSGVINIILKKNYQGVEVGGSYGFSTNKGNWETRRFSLVAGGSAGKTDLTFSAEWKKSDPLIQNERPFSTGLYRTPSFAGVVSIANDFYYLNPNSNAPAGTLDLSPAGLVAQGVYQGPLTQDQVAQFLDLANYPTLLAAAERRSFTAAVEHKLTDTITLFADGIYTVNDTETVLNAQPVTGSVTATNSLNPFNATVTARNRFLPFPRIYDNQSISSRLVAGLRGQLPAGWSYEGAINLNRTNHYYRNKNLIDAAKYTELVTATTFNPFARNQAPGVIESMLGTQTRDYLSTLRSVDARIAGPAFQLPAGPIELGIGANFTWEVLDFTNDRLDQTGGWLGATPRQPFHAQQNVDGYFAEVRVPIFSERNSIPGAHVLELTVATRYDRYSTTSDPTVPKYSLRWMPFSNEFALRGTYSESFVAPKLYELYGPLSVGFTSSFNIIRYDASGNSLGVNTGNRQYRSQTGSNRNLRPSESRNWTAGMVWSPKAIKGFSASLDWFNIDERDIVTTIPTLVIVNDVEQKGPRSPYASLVRLATSVSGETHFTDGAPITASGQMTSRPSDEVWITNSNVNVAGYWQQGLDFNLNYKWKTQGAGQFSASVLGTYLHEYVVQVLPGGAGVGYQDGFYNRSADSTGVFPRYRTNSRLDWALSNWTASVAHTFIPELDDLTNTTPYRVSSYHTFDFQVGHNFTSSRSGWLRGFQVAVGVNNAFNKYPPLIPSEGNQSHDINAYDPIGRFVYVQARYKF